MEKSKNTVFGAVGGLAGAGFIATMLTGGGWQKAAAVAAKAETNAEAAHAPSPLEGGPGRTLLIRHLQVTALGLDSLERRASSGSFRVLVATVPDPSRTRLDWAYDANVEALRRAAESGGYVLDGFWLPWDFDKNTPNTDSVPGAMLFRKAAHSGDGQDLLLVYLVGETPTAGVSAPALQRALKERSELLSGHWFRAPADSLSADTVRIVGPTFSGSASSLARALAAWRTAQPNEKGAPPPVVSIVTGSATLAQNAEFLNSPKQGMEFSATVHSATEYLAAFDTLMRGRMGIRPEQVAMLEETSTSFGQLSSARDARGMLRVAMPTHVSAVRDQAGDDASGRLSPADMLHDGRGALAMSLRGRSTDAEAPAQHSGLTPALTSLILDELIRTLQQHDIRAVGLQFTDVRDNLFVGEQIRARLHDVQLFAFESNALYLRPESNSALGGMVVFSTYPLFMESDEWAPGVQPLPSQQLFPSDGAEGVYNATVLQLGGERLADYTWRSGATDSARLRPPVWMTVLGTHSLAPVNVVRIDDGYVRSISAKSGGGRPQAEGTAATQSEELHRVGGIALATCLGAGLVLMAAALRALLALDVRRKEVLDSLREVADARAKDYPVFFEQLKDDAPALLRRVRNWSRKWTGGTPTPALATPDSVPVVHGNGAPDFPEGPKSALAVAVAPELRERRRLGQTVRRAAWETAAGLRPSHFLKRATKSLSHEKRRKAVHSGALQLHREMFGTLRLFAIGGAVLPLFALLATAGLPQGWISMTAGVAVAAVGAAVAVAFAGGLTITLLLIASYGAEAHRFAVRDVWRSPREGWAWMGEIATRLLIIGAGLVYVGATAWFVYDVWTMHARPEFALFYLRALQGTSGVSPLVPLFVLGAGLAAWCTWHVKRITLLSNPTTFEGAFVDPVVASEANRTAGDGRREMRCRLGGLLGDVRTSLFLTMPRGHSLAFACTVLAIVVLVAHRFQPTLEAAVLPAASGAVGPLGHALHMMGFVAVAGVIALLLAPQLRLWWVAAVAAIVLVAVLFPSTGLLDRYRQPLFVGLTSFDVLLRLGVLGILAVTLWGVYRFVMVWAALRRVLVHLEETPLLAAFSRVPERISRLARGAVFGATPQQAIDGALATLWARLAGIYVESGAKLKDGMPATQAEDLEAIMRPDPGWPCRSELWGDTSARAGVRQLFAAVQDVWSRETNEGAAIRLREGVPAHGDVRAADAEAHLVRLYKGYDPDVAEWLQTAEDYLALQAVDYFQWAVESLYRLAGFLFIILLLGTALLSSYPFQPQSLAKIVFLVVLIATVASLLAVMTQMNRDEILSRVARTEPGKITWDSSFVLNGMLIGIVPMLALVSSEFPGVRDLLFSWLGPLMKSVIGT